MPPTQNSTSHDGLQQALAGSRALSRLLAAQPALAEETRHHLHEPLDEAGLQDMLPAALTEDQLKLALRQLKRRAYARIVSRDLSGLASLAEVTESMTLLAEVSLAAAQRVLMAALVARYGVPRNAAGEAQQLIVIGMGKLGGRELNVSSDIDLIFVYPDDGETDGAEHGLKRIDNFDFFSRLGRSLINAIADITGDGQVFRVDMRLRPNGDSGPLVCSFDMLENYFITQGREWERYAWIKARPLTTLADGADPALTAAWLAALEALRRPFVFRKYLDFGAIDALRELHSQIRREVARKDMVGNVKLGPGGIREIEFIAQVFQLIRGGRDVPLQVKPTLQVLPLLAERRQLSVESVRKLTMAYEYLRRLEHRLQYLEDAQTHSLPATPADQAIIAGTLGYPGFEALLAELDDHRQTVTEHFEAVFADPHKGRARAAGDELWQESPAPGHDEPPSVDAALGQRLHSLGYRDTTRVMTRLAATRSGNRYQQMPEATRSRFDALAPLVIEACARTDHPEDALQRLLDLLEAVSRRPAYLSLLLQYPHALHKVATLAAASSWAADYLKHHPVLLDELLDPGILELAPDWTAFGHQLEQSLAAAEPDTERQMDLLREAHHAQVFRLLVQDINGVLSIERLADHLSALADVILEQTLHFAWRKITKRHIDTPRLAVISYGKLGGKELGYASDLDLVFLMEDEDPAAAENYARLATRLNTWLSSQTAAGQLFEIDVRLRPNGDAGLLVSSLAAFRQYQLEAAWLWEHQALTRARFSAGDPAIGAVFEDIRSEVLRQPRNLDTLRAEVLAMRRRMLHAHATPADQAATVFDLKQDRGGLIDVEFIVQYLVLGHAHQYPQLTANLGNIALLKMAAELNLIPAALAETVRDAYRDYRRMQHLARLNNAKAHVAPAQVAERITAVRALWHAVFGHENVLAEE
ncbi:MAG: bifunctional [glutamate--ammonia ligase]-adenylyl-L-tyrosine phosphorylase/[glutamate--ammonia-ligase] adenylyltransferase [Sterolibacterium sp.]|nr:bifunctional [glutamate--ammonia ligase]-adenylyl-L-tyrosine phosphorylase/[glutamate--ammonia-ligase] adenylyltransferase [Sterolibacterium sp.]MBP9798714.1 bifunctional [glutamate--ammonia ligase]-adenylyl-L-tyrosine phosphorylase/[glutamate--ammonia-ligase] adenylyltransferase [Sterolibacterium sp.]